MDTRRVQSGYQWFALALIVPLLFGMIALAPPRAAAQPLPPPTVGEIVVDSFNCETGRLVYHVYVENLVHVPDPADRLDYPMRGTQVYNYEGGSSDTPTYLNVFNPSATYSPLTGDITTTTFVPITNPADPESGPVVSILISVSVGDGDPGSFDASSTSYAVDCDNESLVDQLIAVLIQILDDLLNA